MSKPSVKKIDGHGVCMRRGRKDKDEPRLSICDAIIRLIFFVTTVTTMGHSRATGKTGSVAIITCKNYSHTCLLLVLPSTLTFNKAQ